MKGGPSQSSRPIEDYPECPECETELPVIGVQGDQTADYECLRCGRRFDG